MLSETKPMTVGELMEKLKVFDSNMPVQIHDHFSPQIRVFIEGRDVILYPFDPNDIEHGIDCDCCPYGYSITG